MGDLLSMVGELVWDLVMILAFEATCRPRRPGGSRTGTLSINPGSLPLTVRLPGPQGISAGAS